jgi:hypothetical protein
MLHVKHLTVATMPRKSRSVQTLLFDPGPIDRRVPVTPQARAMTRKKVTAPSPKPWLCALLSIDTADNSGFALYVQGELKEFGEVQTKRADLVLEIVSRAKELADAAGLPLVLVLEKAWGGKLRVVLGLGAARERWMGAWRAAKCVQSKVVQVTPSVWRAPVLGSYYASKVPDRAEIRRAEQTMAAGLVGAEVGPDAAPAILIGRWASHAPEVGDALGKRVMRKSWEAWAGTRKRAPRGAR